MNQVDGSYPRGWSIKANQLKKPPSARFAKKRHRSETIELIDRIEYWYYWNEDGQRVRYHKFVYFYLLRYKSGDTSDHDHEVLDARWVDIADAIKMLAFESEKKIVEKAKELFGQFGSVS